MSDAMTACTRTGSPVVGVKDLKLGEVSVERRDVFHPSAPECTDFENVAYGACDLHMREWKYQRMGEAHELQQGPRELTTLVEGTAQLLPGQSKAQNVRGVHERPQYSEPDGSHLELCKQLPCLCEIGGASFKHHLEFMIERGHMRGRHAGN